jgi:hypothetical protein
MHSHGRVGIRGVAMAVVALAVAVFMSFSIRPAFASTASGATNGWQFAAGRGYGIAAGRAYVQFAFWAQSSPRGTSGQITLNWPAAGYQPPSDHGQLLANVSCLFVAGNTAIAYGKVTKSVNIDGPPNPDWVSWAVTDGGGPGGADTAYGAFGYGPPPCAYVPPPTLPILCGSIYIHSCPAASISANSTAREVSRLNRSFLLFQTYIPTAAAKADPDHRICGQGLVSSSAAERGTRRCD